MKKILFSLFIAIFIFSVNSFAQDTWGAGTAKPADNKQVTKTDDPVLSYDWNSIPEWRAVVQTKPGAAAQMRIGVVSPGEGKTFVFNVKVRTAQGGYTIYPYTIMFNTDMKFDKPTRWVGMCYANPGSTDPTIWGN